MSIMNPDFINNMVGGAFVYRASDDHKLVYVSNELSHFFECEDTAEFYANIGDTFDDMVEEEFLETVLNSIALEASGPGSSGYVFYNILTIMGNVRRIVHHWTLVHDEDLGDIFYCIMYYHKREQANSDYDKVTELNTRSNFHSYVSAMNEKLSGKDNTEYAIVYMNLVNFKLLNISSGVKEGDTCLKVIAEILKSEYKDGYIARLSDDHFAIFVRHENLYQRTKEVENRFLDAYGRRNNVMGKYGIYRFVPNKEFDVESALSLAKVACDYIKYNPLLHIAYYSNSLAKRVQTTEYVVRYIDEAIEKGWIKIYYQPVVRSITKQFCGMESLVRWDDPVMGFLHPTEFVPNLEREKCIHKLDSYVAEKVCECLNDRMKKGLPVVAVSINFSRVDFMMCDMLEVVEEAVKKYDIPRKLIHIEITESMISSDEKMMKHVINGFRDAGYEIWMDDFGSGYSSLTLLKDYQFDMLKLDMRFLYPFTEKSKDIVKATLGMAKDIGIKTLTEGVETDEHLDFLVENGCEMIQGFYYGKPEPIDDVFRHMEEQGITIEDEEWRDYYAVASTNVRGTKQPLEIIEDDGKEFRTLFMNDSYKKQIFDRDMDLSEIDDAIYHTPTPLITKYREIAEIIENSSDRSEDHIFYYTSGDKYLRFSARVIAENQGKYLIKGSILNISQDMSRKKSSVLDQKLRGLTNLFDVVLLIDVGKSTVESMMGETKYFNSEKYETNDLKTCVEMVTNKSIHPDDRKRYLEYMDGSTMYERVKESGQGYLIDIFRVLQDNGEYMHKEVILMLISGTEGKQFRYCVKNIQNAKDIMFI